MLVRTYSSPTNSEFLADLKQSLETLGCFTKVETGPATEILTDPYNTVACSVGDQVVINFGGTDADCIANKTYIYSVSGTQLERNYHSGSSYDSTVYLYSTGQYVFLELTGSYNADGGGSIIRFHIFTKDKNNNPIVFFRWYVGSSTNYNCSNMNINNIKRGYKDYFNVHTNNGNNSWSSNDARPYSLTTEYIVYGDETYESLPDIYALIRRQPSIVQQYDFTGMTIYTYKPPSELIIDGTPYITNGEVLLKA